MDLTNGWHVLIGTFLIFTAFATAWIMLILEKAQRAGPAIMQKSKPMDKTPKWHDVAVGAANHSGHHSSDDHGDNHHDAHHESLEEQDHHDSLDETEGEDHHAE